MRNQMGMQNNKQRWLCRNCHKSFIVYSKQKSIVRQISWFKKWIIGRMTLREIANKKGLTIQTIRALFKNYLDNPPLPKIKPNNSCHLIIDGTYTSDFCVLNYLDEVDYILELEVIEHLPNIEEFVSKIKNKARKSLIFSIPNRGYYSHRMRLLSGRFPLQWINNPSEHLRFWTVKDIKWWVNFMGLNSNKIIIYEGLPILNKIFPNLFGQGIIIKIKNEKNEI
ncbi:MAG: methyltransferase domain-containing protein [Xanthomonadaceae bacterium]|nr:methyltransferase domain-containing protein [Rhodospirillaceae bacterium]NIA17937.1 methyltransferase domain-containing protein [Xanthomonadaceae bacterium]